MKKFIEVWILANLSDLLALTLIVADFAMIVLAFHNADGLIFMIGLGLMVAMLPLIALVYYAVDGLAWRYLKHRYPEDFVA